jgi:hypothetical protein
MRRFAHWLFADPPGARSLWGVVGWWELRIPFNIIVGDTAPCVWLSTAGPLLPAGRLTYGEDAVEPIALLAAPLGINLLYTLGWLVELPARLLNPGLTPRFGPYLLQLGLVLGLFLTTCQPPIGAGIASYKWLASCRDAIGRLAGMSQAGYDHGWWPPSETRSTVPLFDPGVSVMSQARSSSG